MKVLFNCSNNVVGGAIQNSANFIKYAREDSSIDYMFIVSAQVAEVLKKWGLEVKKLEVLDSPATSKIARSEALRIESEFKPDLVYTMAGPTYIRFKSFHVMGTSDPYITHSKLSNFKKNRSFSELLTFSIKIALKAISARFGADYFLFQTATSRDGFCRRYLWSKNRTRIVSNALGEDFFDQKLIQDETKNGKVTVFCPSAYYPHKNLESIIALAREVREQSQFKFVVTTPPNCKFEQEIADSGLQNLENIGPFSYVEAAKLYSESDIVMMPSLLETFSTSYLEAIAFAKPLVVADTEFSREICEEYAAYFEADNIKSLTRAFEKAKSQISDTDKSARARILGKYGTQKERYLKIKSIILELVKSKL